MKLIISLTRKLECGFSGLDHCRLSMEIKTQNIFIAEPSNGFRRIELMGLGTP